jgi:polysaccharide export outer membrane protein
VSKPVPKGLICLTLVFVGLCQAGETFASRESRYHLHPGDVITVDYRYSPEYNATVAVQPDGFATLPLLGDIKMGGLTLSEARSQLLVKAGERLNDPEITLNLKEFEKPYYIVGGEVGQPGKFEIRGRVTALRAVEMAGGFKTSGKASQVLLIRPVNNVDAQTKLLDLKKVIDRAQLNEDVELRAGDMLVVPKTPIAKIEPYIRIANIGMYLNPLGF